MVISAATATSDGLMEINGKVATRGKIYQECKAVWQKSTYASNSIK